MTPTVIKDHPAETAMPLATVLAALVARALGVEDTDTILYIALAISFIPAIVTWIVNLRQGASDGGDRGQAPRPSEVGSASGEEAGGG
jgi:hypothetical protein